MNTLLTEIIACLAAAAFFSLFIGWAIRSSLANREIKQINQDWETKQAEQELKFDQETGQMTHRIQGLETEVRQLGNSNQSMSESLRENELTVHKARADAIELNRQQANTQERLQRIIAQKDEEIKLLRDGTMPDSGSVPSEALKTETDANSAKIATLSAKREAWEKERERLLNDIGEDQQTVAIDPADIPIESLDRTVRMNPDQLAEIQELSRNKDMLDADKTQSLAEDDPTISINYSDPLRPDTTPSKPGGSPDKKED